MHKGWLSSSFFSSSSSSFPSLRKQNASIEGATLGSKHCDSSAAILLK
jgi:hypothetical protein